MSLSTASSAAALTEAEPTSFRAAELSIVVPTFNEHDNIASVIGAIDAALPGVAWEVVFVDDNSPDGTADEVRRYGRTDPRVRSVQRVGRRGLSSACIEGMLATSADLIAVMDADMQHDEKVLPQMLARIRHDGADLAVGTRYAGADGGVSDWDATRARMSLFATRLANRLIKTPLSDPMSGFFMIRREAFMAALPNLSAIGFKILLDITVSTPKPLRISEVPYTFRSRLHGESKLNAVILWEYLLLILDKMAGRIVPVRFISFALVGASGVLVSLTVLSVLFKLMHLPFTTAQFGATLVAITTNFLLNNALTYRDRLLSGFGLVWGWLSFNAVSAVGVLGNVGIAAFMYDEYSFHWLVSALAGIAVGVVWNYAASASVTWRRT